MIRVTLLLIIILTCCLSMNLYAQNSNPLDDMLSNPESPKPTRTVKSTESDSLVNDIIRINYEKKNAQLAMLMSALVPGSGQFYVSKSNIMAYIFPIIEIAVISGIVYYDYQGDKKTKVFKKYVDETVTIDINGYSYTGPRYVRAFQDTVQNILIDWHHQTADIYDGVYFNLDKKKSQHYYEDIGKYNKYIFGWVDWYFKYAELPPVGSPLKPNPQWVFNNNENSQNNKWQYNIPIGGSSYDRPSSKLRDEYVTLRQAAEDKYRVANYLAFGIALNHIVSAVDAARTANSQNRLYLSQNKIKMHYYASLNDGHITPMLGLRYSF